MTTNLDRSHRPHEGSQGEGSRIGAGQLLLALRRHRINCSIDSMSSGGWTARLGEPGLGLYSQQGHFRTREEAAAWLLDEAERRGAVVVESRRPLFGA